MRVELCLSVMAGSSHQGFDPSASVGKPKLTSGARESAVGYKRPFDTSRTTSNATGPRVSASGYKQKDRRG